MDKIFFDMGGEVDEFISDKDKPKHVRFPVKLAVKRRKKNDQNHKGPERRGGLERRSGKDRRKHS